MTAHVTMAARDQGMGWLFVGLLSAVYLYLSTRFPIWNFDDVHYYEFHKNNGWEGLKILFLGTDIPNEYRTYSFSRTLQFLLFRLAGDRPFIFYALMAFTHLGSTLLIYLNVRNLSGDSRSFSAEAFGCAMIWLFSPFSIVGTFHHFSYLLLPFYMLLAYIFLVESSRKSAKFRTLILISTLLILVCLSGEATIPALFAYLLIKLFQRSDRRFAIFQIALGMSTLLFHHALLDRVNSFATRAPRFSFSAPDLSVQLVANLRYFFASVASLVAQGLNLDAISYEPYYPGLPIHSFAWQHVSAPFLIFCAFALPAILLARKLLGAASIKADGTHFSSRTTAMDMRTFIAITLFVLSLWALYVGMTISGAKLYGGPFALQLRYGYVVIPMSLCLVFLALRIPSAGPWIQRLAWAIPLASAFFWLASQTIVAPRNAAQNADIIALLSNAHARGVRIIRIEHPNFTATEPPIRPFGITNPFIRWGDSPFQQDWTTDVYLRTFLGQSVYRGDLVAWGDNSLIMVDGQSNVDRKKFASIGAKSIGRTVVDYPQGDITMSYELQRKGTGLPAERQHASRREQIAR